MFTQRNFNLNYLNFIYISRFFGNNRINNIIANITISKIRPFFRFINSRLYWGYIF